MDNLPIIFIGIHRPNSAAFNWTIHRQANEVTFTIVYPYYKTVSNSKVSFMFYACFMVDTCRLALFPEIDFRVLVP